MVNKVIVATHKEYKMPKGVDYIPVQVGATLNSPLNYQRDDDGENISSKNPSFCELTGLYWAWKNLDADYIGLVHYRRHFSYKKVSNDSFENILTDDQINKLTEKFDVIVPKKRHYYIESLYSHYKHTHYESQLVETKKIVKEYFPDYVDSYNKVLKRTWGYMFNMMIMRRELVNDYCTWLFKILFELEKRVNDGQVSDSQNLSAFQGRFYGRISELLFNVWLDYMLSHHELERDNIKEIKYVTLGKVDWMRKISSFIFAKLFNKKYNRSF